MDTPAPTSLPPSGAPTPTPAPDADGQAPAEPFGSGPPTSPAAPVAPPPDPYAGGFSAEEWDALAHDAQMDRGELQAIFGPARQVAAEFGGAQLAALLESDDPVFGGLGNDANLIRALGTYGDDMRHYLADEQSLVNELRTLAQARGQRLTNPAVAPLAGKALDDAVHRLLDRYLPNTGARKAFESAGVFTHPVVQGMLQRMAQVQHRAVGVLSALSQQRAQWQGDRDTRREQAQVSGMAHEVKAMSEAEYQARYGALFQQYQEASAKGRWVDKARISEQLTALAKARWG